ncbi:hypothetical protein BJX66DRAFT_142019 [Aspergillus keveii]|uniref:Uncharacterized protein n=1 Tax=Aspergillus keveii TaxID=714993 RepID=A0ABR4GAY7_9EURO
MFAALLVLCSKATIIDFLTTTGLYITILACSLTLRLLTCSWGLTNKKEDACWLTALWRPFQAF